MVTGGTLSAVLEPSRGAQLPPPRWCTRSMLVVPATPGGEPAVMMQMSPGLKRLSLAISWSTRSTISSVLLTNGTTWDSTPQLSVSWLRVDSSVVNAMIGWTAR
ncbi:hypothetical protein SALBM311S_06673 [Streptomyces alboniger]